MQDQTMWFGWYLMLVGFPFMVETLTLTVKELPICCGTPVQRHKKGA
jgi:hypothetical protein